ncbi:MAG: CsgG/HfaB family protein [Prevotellaceae bacterium]|nr:CsgG/HfaB family protein [Prevotellaceae bacterium]
MKKTFALLPPLFVLPFLSLQAQRKTVVVETPTTEVKDDELVLKRKVAIGCFSNETQYAKGLFYDKENDPMGKQALDILSAKLAASGKFMLLERSDLASLLEECQKNSGGAATIGADYMIIGSITEFGRKNTGKNGVFSSQKNTDSRCSCCNQTCRCVIWTHHIFR